MTSSYSFVRLFVPVAAALVVVACGKKDVSDNESLVQAFAVQAPLCTYPIKWPADVGTDEVAKAPSRPTSLASQLAVLEKLGFARSEHVTKENAKLYGGSFTTEFVRFSLTDAGQKVIKARWRSDADKGKARICYAQRDVTSIVAKKELKLNGVPGMQVSYTYQIKEPAPFLNDPQFQKAFPEVSRVLEQAGKVTCQAVVEFPEGKAVEVVQTPDGLSNCQGDY